MDRDEVLHLLRNARSSRELDHAGKAARDWLAANPDDNEIQAALTEATNRVEPRGGRA